jgi:hypothetical protein
MDEPMMTCKGCGSDIDPEVCWCGTAIADHVPMLTQCPCIPMGCTCYRSTKNEEPADDPA